MHPYLFDWVVGGQHIKPPSYGVLLAIAFTLAYFESLRLSVKTKDGPRHVENLFLIVIISSVVGARMFHVLFEDLDYFLKNPAEIFYIWNGGYTLYGAVLLGIFCGWIYTRINKINFFEFADIGAAPIAMGIGIGRLGCFLAGCCWGDKCNLPWAVTFTDPTGFAGVRNIPLHPTQVYEALLCFALYGYLTWRFKHRSYYGQAFLHFLLGYSLIRFGVEYFRGDDYRGFVFGGLLSYSQFISLVIIPFSLLATFLFSRRKMEKPGAKVKRT